MGSGKIFTGIFVLALVLAGAYIFSISSNPPKNIASVINNPPQTGNSSNAQSIKFSDTQAYPYSYLISSDTLSSDAQQALTGFQLNKTSHSDGSVTYTLTALKQNYYNQVYNLKPSQSLYFIEMSSGDDSVIDNYDRNLGDDHAIIVGSDGYVVQP